MTRDEATMVGLLCVEHPPRFDTLTLGTTRIYVEHPSGVRVCIHEGPTAETRYERACREAEERVRRPIG